MTSMIKTRQELAEENKALSTSLDRAQAFSWRDAAEKIWQLHAEL